MFVFLLMKIIARQLLWFWTQHNPHAGGQVWLLGQVTWNLPDLSGVRKANCSLPPPVPAALHTVLENTEDLIEDINHLDLLTLRTLRNDSKMIRNPPDFKVQQA